MLKRDQPGAESSGHLGLSGRKRLALVASSTLLTGLWLGGYDWLRPERYRSFLVGLVSGLIMGMYLVAPRFGLLDRLLQPGIDYSTVSTWKWPGVGARRLYELVVVVAGIQVFAGWFIKGEVPTPLTLLWVPILWAVVSLSIRIHFRGKSG